MLVTTLHKGLRIALAGVACLCFVLLFVGGPGSDASRTFSYGWELGHLFSFFLWSFLYLQWRRSHSLLRRSGEVLLLAVLLGGGTELLQAVVGRDAAWQDFGNDVLGSLFALFFSIPRHNFNYPRLLQGGRLVALLLIGWLLLPFVKVSFDELVAWQQFPLLCGFETPQENSRWGGNSSHQLDRRFASHGATSLRVEFNTKRYSGLALRYFPADWSAYRLLRFQVYNPKADPFHFYFRIHDRQHLANESRYGDRFNTELVAAPGWNELEIPLAKVAQAPKGRQMDLTRIAGMGLFVGKLLEPRTIYLDQVELVP